VRNKKGDSWVSQDLEGMLYSEIMDLYPINELVSRVAADSGLTAREILEKLGYKNFNKGKRLLDALIAHNTLSKNHRHFRDKFFEVFRSPKEKSITHVTRRRKFSAPPLPGRQ
jgi:hypothetical protein